MLAFVPHGPQKFVVTHGIKKAKHGWFTCFYLKPPAQQPIVFFISKVLAMGKFLFQRNELTRQIPMFIPAFPCAYGKINRCK